MTARHRGALVLLALLATACGDRGDGGPDLAEAVAAAAPGGTLQLEAGTYQLAGGLVLDEPITIVGAEGGTTIEVRLERTGPLEDRSAFRVRADNVRLVGLAITTDDENTTLVEVENGSLELSEVDITGGRVGVRYSVDGAGEVRDGGFEGSRFGLIVAGSSVVIENNEFSRHQEGIVFDAQSTATARGNTINGSSTNGVLVQADARPFIVANTFSDNGGGIAFYEGAAGTATDNTISDSIWGIDVRAPGPVVLTGNELVGNEVAIQFWIDAGTGEIRDNSCADNGEDIVLAGPITPDVGDNACVTSTGPAHDPTG